VRGRCGSEAGDRDQGIGDREKQIPCGNDRKKSNGKCKNGRALRARSRFFPFGFAQGQNDNAKSKSKCEGNYNCIGEEERPPGGGL
jgi:hypothetical protein